MPIKEKSFRIGCGRYLQEKGLLSSCGDELLRYGHSPLIVGGPTALSLTREKLESSLTAKNMSYRIFTHSGSCNEEDAQKLSDLARAEGYDVIVGVGGGVIMDFSKLIGYFAEMPVVNIPTSSATCAAYTPLSVRYTPEGKTVGSRHYEYEVDSVIADTEIISAQPPRLLLSGVFDALAKFVEIKHRFSGEQMEECPLGLDYAYVLSTHSYAVLCEKTEKCLEDMKNQRVTDTAEQVIFTSIAATGVISGIARGSNQTALAHKFYETVRVLHYSESRPYLHGEIVGIGLLLQNFFNGEESENKVLTDLMDKYGMPKRLSDIGISPTKETMEAYYDVLKKTAAVAEGGPDAPKKLRAALEYLWSID